MKVMIVGGGGREHAILQKIKENPAVTQLFALPGNGTMAKIATCVPIGATEIEKAVEFAEKEQMDFVIVSPDNPLCMGLVDLLEARGIKAFGPRKAAARIEGSKVFSKNLMKKYHIPTADYQVFGSAGEAKAFVEQTAAFPLVIKADGLAYGKGVIICQNKDEALKAVKEMMEEKIFGSSGSEIVIEEFMQGPEVSVLCFTDGKTIKPMLSSMDYKRAYEGDKGPNTGGMGAIAPNPYYTKEIEAQCMREIFLPTMKALNQENSQFKGCLYFGLMLTSKGPKVVEYNCRFGDPETQCIMPLLKSDLLTIMLAVADEELHDAEVLFSSTDHSLCVSLCSKGYPLEYEKSKELTIAPTDQKGLFVYDCGSKIGDQGNLLTDTGRVVSVVGTGQSLAKAREKAYQGIGSVHFENIFYRGDIGQL